MRLGGFPKAARIPHRDDPGDPWSGDEWDRLYAPRHDEASAPDAIETDNPIVGELLGPKGETIRTWRERPRRGVRLPTTPEVNPWLTTCPRTGRSNRSTLTTSPPKATPTSTAPETTMADASDRGWGPGWPNCQTGTIVTIKRADGLRLPVRREIAPLVAWLIDETERRGYDVVHNWTWGYACRPIRGSSKPSNHSWGLAVDINAPTNPMGSTLITDMPPWLPELWQSYGFRWGGTYQSRPDAMHMEFMGTPADAARYIAQINTPPEPPKGWLMALTDEQQTELYEWTKDTHAKVTDLHNDYAVSVEGGGKHPVTGKVMKDGSKRWQLGKTFLWVKALADHLLPKKG